MAMGWTRWKTQRGQIMIGNRSVRQRTISNESEPAPTMMAARSSVTGTAPALSRSPVACREARCSERRARASPRPPRYTMCLTPRRLGRVREVPRGREVTLAGSAPRAHAVDEVVRGVASGERWTEGGGLEHIAPRDLDLGAPRSGRRRAQGRARAPGRSLPAWRSLGTSRPPTYPVAPVTRTRMAYC